MMDEDMQKVQSSKGKRRRNLHLNDGNTFIHGMLMLMLMLMLVSPQTAAVRDYRRRQVQLQMHYHKPSAIYLV